MKAWSNNPNAKHPRVYVYDKMPANSGISSKKIEDINYIDLTYDILPGDVYTNQTALDAMFGFLDSYSISYANKKLSSHKDFNRCYFDFDKWHIEDSLGNPVSDSIRKSIKDKLESAHFSFIEDEWGKQYESKWNFFITDFETRLRSIDRTKSCTSIVTQDDLDKVMTFFLIFDFRSDSRNDFINECLHDSIDKLREALPEVDDIIPESERNHLNEKTFVEQIERGFYRETFYKFLSSHDGPLKLTLDANRNHLGFQFCLTDIGNPFITSNNPAFTNVNTDSLKEKIFIATPTMAIVLLKTEEPNKVCISLVNSDGARKINKDVYKNNVQLILPDKSFDIESIKN